MKTRSMSGPVARWSTASRSGGDRAVARVLRRLDDDQRVGVLECVQLERRGLGEQLVRRLEQPRRRRRPARRGSARMSA